MFEDNCNIPYYVQDYVVELFKNLSIIIFSFGLGLFVGVAYSNIFSLNLLIVFFGLCFLYKLIFDDNISSYSTYVFFLGILFEKIFLSYFAVDPLNYLYVFGMISLATYQVSYSGCEIYSKQLFIIRSVIFNNLIFVCLITIQYLLGIHLFYSNLVLFLLSFGIYFKISRSIDKALYYGKYINYAEKRKQIILQDTVNIY